MSFSNYDFLDIKKSCSKVYDFSDIQNEIYLVEGQKTQEKNLKHVSHAIDGDFQPNA